jgi:hypothetical protein
MERAVGLHNRHTGSMDGANPIVGAAVAQMSDQSEGGMGGAERAWRRAMRLGQSRR